MIRESKIIRKISSWYFNKSVLPYWVILLLDTVVVFLSAVFTYWVINRTLLLFENRISVSCTALLFALLSWVGARLFKTYAGVLRYSSTVDLTKLAYSNLVTMFLALGFLSVFRWAGV